METETKFIVGVNLLNAIGEYLSQRPYREVLPLMNGLAQLKPMDQGPPKGDEVSK